MFENSLEFAVRSMMFENHTHIVVRRKSNKGFCPVGGSNNVMEIIRRYGDLELESSYIMDNILYITVK